MAPMGRAVSYIAGVEKDVYFSLTKPLVMRTHLTLSFVLLSSLGAFAQCNATIPPTCTVFTAASGSLAVTLTQIWVCSGAYPNVSGNYNLIYMEDGATLSLDGDSNVVYSKGNNYIYINPGSDVNGVIHEGTGSNIANNGIGNTLLPCPTVIFDYTNAPSPGCGGVGIAEQAPTSSITLQPTAVTDLLRIKVDGMVTVREIWLLDSNGREVLHLAVDGSEPVDLRALSAGSYIVKLMTDQGTVVRRVEKL